MGKSKPLATVVLILLVVGCGCLGPDEEVPLEPANDSEIVERNEGVFPITIVDLQTIPTAWEADVLCLNGGAPLLPRESGNHVREGTLDLEIEVSIPRSYTATQVGYVVDSNNAAHAADNNKTVSWLPQVLPGEEKTFVVEVGDRGVEAPDEIRWGFYQRMQPPSVDDVCYTGGGIGEKQVTITAVG